PAELLWRRRLADGLPLPPARDPSLCRQVEGRSEPAVEAGGSRRPAAPRRPRRQARRCTVLRSTVLRSAGLRSVVLRSAGLRSAVLTRTVLNRSPATAGSPSQLTVP